MIGAVLWLTGFAWMLAPASPSESCPQPPDAHTPSSGDFVTGWPTSFPAPTAAAMSLNLEAAALYKQQRYKEAAAKYRAADAADPSFLAPRLNLAGLFVRQDKYSEAAAVLASLLRDGFVPWHHQAREAVDLAALWARQRESDLPAAVSQASRHWGATVAEGILMLSRLRPPIRLAPQDGALPLFPQQEIIAWNPRTGRFHQVTAQNGRVLAFVRAKQRNAALYVTAEKVRRLGGRLMHFEGVAVVGINMDTMENFPPVRIEGAVTRIAFGFDGKGRAVAQVFSPERSPVTYQVEPTSTRSSSAQLHTPPRLATAVTLTVAGVQPTQSEVAWPGCALLLRDNFAREPPSPTVQPGKGRAFLLPSRYGLGLSGLPLSGLEPPPKP